MFSMNMSYDEIITAVGELPSPAHLSKFQRNCLTTSLRNPFVTTLFNLYPVSEHIKRIIHQVSQDHPTPEPLNLNVHNGVLAEQRARTKNYLFQRFDSKIDSNIMLNLESFVTSSLSTKEIMDELLLSYKTRAFKSKNYQMQPEQIELAKNEIISDFSDYLNYIKRLKDAKSTYSWAVLSCLLKRIEAESVETSKLSAQLELMRALDDSRTAYFGQTQKFDLSGKDYSCPQGLEERCLDHHVYLAPATVKKDYEKNIEMLFAPFLQSVKDQHGFHSQYVCSPILMHVYASFAGYASYVNERILFEIPEAFTEEDATFLKNEYLAFKHGLTTADVTMLLGLGAAAAYQLDSDVTHPLHSKRKPIVIESKQLTILMATIKARCASYKKESVPDFIKFWQNQQQYPVLIETLDTEQEPEFVHDGQSRTTDDIIEAMAEFGPFVDKAHVLIIKALFPFSKIEEMIQADPRLHQIAYEDFDKDRMLDCYRLAKRNLLTIYRDYYDFYLPELDQFLLSSQHMIAPACSEEAFLYFLRKHQSDLSTNIIKRKKLEQYVLLSVKNGYHRVLVELLAAFNVSVDTICPQERKSLLELACEIQNAEGVKILLSFGALVNRAGTNYYPIHLAARRGDLEIMTHLLSYGADINQSSKNGGYTPLMLAILNNHMTIARKLIDLGADLTKMDAEKNTALICFSKVDLTSIHAVQLIDRILMSLKTDKNTYNKIINGSDVELILSQKTALMRMSTDQFFLKIAIAKNNPKLIDLIIKHNQDLGLTLRLDLLILLIASQGHVRITKHCLKKNYLTIKDADARGLTLLDYAIILNKAALVDFLLSFYDVAAKDLLISTWFKAAKANALKVMQKLKARDNNLLYEVDEHGRNAFFYSVASYEYLSCYLKIYNRKVDFSQKDSDGSSLLVTAVTGVSEYEKELMYFLLDQSQQSMTPEDFEEEYRKAIAAALLSKKEQTLVVLATYKEKYFLEQSIVDGRISLDELQHPANIFCGKEIKIFGLLSWHLLRLNDGIASIRLPMGVFENLAFQMLSEIESQLKDNVRLTEVDYAILTYSINLLWKIGRLSVTSNHSPILVEYRTNSGLSLYSHTITFLKILNKALSIRLEYLPVNNDPRLMVGLSNHYETIISNIIKSSSSLISREKKEVLRSLLSIILKNITEKSDVGPFRRLLQQLTNIFDVLKIASAQSHPTVLLFLLMNSICKAQTRAAHHVLIAGALSYAQKNNKKSIELLLISYGHMYLIQDHLPPINLLLEEQYESLLEVLKNAFDHSWHRDSAIGLLALLQKIKAKDHGLLADELSPTENKLQLHKKLIGRLFLQALRAIEYDLVGARPDHLSEENGILIDLLITIARNFYRSSDRSASANSNIIQMSESDDLEIADCLERIERVRLRTADVGVINSTCSIQQERIVFSNKRASSTDLQQHVKRFKK